MPSTATLEYDTDWQQYRRSKRSVVKCKQRYLDAYDLWQASTDTPIDEVQVLRGALIGLLAFAHACVQAASARGHCRRLHCSRLVRHQHLAWKGHWLLQEEDRKVW